MQRFLKRLAIALLVIAIILWIAGIAFWMLTKPGFDGFTTFISGIISALLSLLSWLSSRSKRFRRQAAGAGESTHIEGGISGGIVVTGGDHFTINTRDERILNQKVVDSRSVTELVDAFRRVVEIEPTQNHYHKAQFTAYSTVWKRLQELRFSGDRLWQNAKEENLFFFSTVRERVDQEIQREAIFFEEADYLDLLRVLHGFGTYFDGKNTLSELYSQNRRGHVEVERLIAERVAQNFNLKTEYEALLERIRLSFHRRLASLSGRTRAMPQNE